jgi:hypothetical protein
MAVKDDGKGLLRAAREVLTDGMIHPRVSFCERFAAQRRHNSVAFRIGARAGMVTFGALGLIVRQ